MSRDSPGLAESGASNIADDLPDPIIIEIEGPSGAGKSTLVQAITGMSSSDRHYVDVVAVESCVEQSTAVLGNFMRDQATPLNQLDAAFLFCARTAARCRAISELIRRKAQGTLVIDRLRLSLYAQLRMASMSPDLSRQLTQHATYELRPAVTVLLDISYATHLQRLGMRGHEPLPIQHFDEWRQCLHEGFDNLGAAGLRIDTSELSRELVFEKVASVL